MKNDLILLGHGSGGRLSHQLLDELIIPIVSGVARSGQNDAALLEAIPGRSFYGNFEPPAVFPVRDT